MIWVLLISIAALVIAAHKLVAHVDNELMFADRKKPDDDTGAALVVLVTALAILTIGLTVYSLYAP